MTISRHFRRRRFEIHGDGQLVGRYRTYAEALEVAEDLHERDVYSRWSVSERIGGQRFNKAFGYQCGTTSTMDLAAMGVPIHPPCLSDERL